MMGKAGLSESQHWNLVQHTLAALKFGKLKDHGMRAGAFQSSHKLQSHFEILPFTKQ